MATYPYPPIVEAKRRGYAVSYLPGSAHYYCITGPTGKQVWFKDTIPQDSSFIGNRFAVNKLWTTEYLKTLGYQLPAAEKYTSARQANYFLKKYQHIAVKPATGEQGIGITVGVSNPEDLQRAVRKARKQAAGYKGVVLQEMLKGGKEYRLLVIGKKFFAAVVRVPAQVVGDGVSTVEQLIVRANDLRRRQHVIHLLPLEEIRQRHGSVLASVPAAKETVVFQELRSISLGGGTEDVTDCVHATYRQIAEHITTSMGLILCGFDLLVDDIAAPCPPTIPLLELNSMPGFGPHQRPLKGRPRNPASALLDYLFVQS